MKIAYLLSSAQFAGAETCFLRFIKKAKRDTNHKFLVVNVEEGPLNDELRRLEIELYIVRKTHVKQVWRNPLIINKSISNYINLYNIIKNFRPDLIHAFTIHQYRRGAILKTMLHKLKIIVTLHDDLTTQHFSYKHYPIVKSINLFFDKLIVVSDDVKKIAVENGVRGEKLIRIYNGLPYKPADNKTKNRSHEFVIGCFGRIVKKKGQHILIQAVERLRMKIPFIKCYIIGSPLPSATDYYDNLKNCVKEKNLNNNIIFIGWTDSISMYYSLLDVYVLPSIYPDPFPTVNLEAMMFALPVIATDKGGSKEQVVHNKTGFIIKQDSVDELAEKLLFLYENPDQAARMGQKGRRRVLQNFTMQQYVKNHFDLYEQIITQNR